MGGDAGVIVAVAAVAGAVSFSAGTGRPRPEKTAADEEVAEAKQLRTMPPVHGGEAPGA